MADDDDIDAFDLDDLIAQEEALHTGYGDDAANFMELEADLTAPPTTDVGLPAATSPASTAAAPHRFNSPPQEPLRTAPIAVMPPQQAPAAPAPSPWHTTVERSIDEFLLERPPESESLAVALPDGRLYFIGLDVESMRDGWRGSGIRPSDKLATPSPESLLDVPIRKLLVNIARESSQRTADVLRRAREAVESTDERFDTMDDNREVRRTDAPTSSASLWVDKYAPRRFFDLLSADAINRDVIRWIKQWDARVFGHHAGKATALGATALPGGGSASSAFFLRPGAPTRPDQGSAAAAAAGRGGKRARRGADAENAAASVAAAGAGGGDSDDADDFAESAAASEGAGRDRARTGASSGAGSSRSGAGRGGRGGGPQGSQGGARGAWRGGRGGGSHSSGGGNRLGSVAAAAAPVSGFSFGWRADARALLFCGPPGMGKTTLAHIAAATAGYRPLEINASDDRSGKSVRERIAAAQSMAPIFGDRRPPLIILDEIDGMESGAGGGIAELVKMINATPSPLTPVGGNCAGDLGAMGRLARDTGGGVSDNSDSDVAAGGSRAARGTSRGPRRRSARAHGGAADADADGAPAVRTSSRVQPLTRPLICICNDQYAPALRELRPLVQIVEFGKTSAERLSSRVRAICRAEGLDVTAEAVSALVSLTDCDIRSCLNTLQFVRIQADASRRALPSRGEKPSGLHSRYRVTGDIITRAAVGVKDQTKALHDVWSAVFRQPDLRNRSTAAFVGLGGSGNGTTGHDDVMDGAGVPLSSLEAEAARIAAPRLVGSGAPKKSWLNHPAIAALARGTGGFSSAATRSRTTYFNELHAQLGGYGAEAPLLLAGLEENLLLSARFSDPTMGHTCAALDWLGYGDEVATRTGGSGSFALLKYVPLAGLGVHLHASSELRVRVAWPRSEHAMRATTEQRSNIMQSFLLGRATSHRSGALGAGALDMRAAVLDMLSPLLTILSPPLRPVNFGLLNSSEKNDVTTLVEVMSSCNINYAPSTVGGRPAWGDDATLVLRPEIHTLVEYAGYDPFEPSMRPSLPDVLKHLIAHEVRLARIRVAALRAAEGEAVDAATASALDADAMSAADTSRPHAASTGANVVRVPAHVAAQLTQAAASSVAARRPAASDEEAAAAAAAEPRTSATVVDRVVPTGMTFLAAAATKSRAVELTRKRAAMNACVRGVSTPLSLREAHRGAGAATAATRGAGFTTANKTAVSNVQDRAAKVTYPVVYRFKEGYTNAVRRPLHLVDFL